MKSIKLVNIACALLVMLSVQAKDYHVSKSGNDANDGSKESPFKTISAAAKLAVVDDVITVHKGVYRERVSPQNAGMNDQRRIVYQAAQGEEVIIKGSEVVENWTKVEGSVWKAVVANDVFGDYNPYSELLVGDWLNNEGFNHHTGEVYLNGKSFFEQNSLEDVKKSMAFENARDQKASTYTWYSEVGDENTTIWANFQEVDPNAELVEINARPACFYPQRPSVNYITVSGFTMSQAATQWAAPTAEQIGLLGVHWSKGWIIENNTISNSKCVGITLGKDHATGHNVWSNNKIKGGSMHYNEVIFRALEIGWSKANIGSHIVRNNVIFDCGQAGIVGSLGAVYSTISNNHIYDIWTKRTFSGAEMGGIKIHAPIDMLISENQIHNTGRGIWLDWMTQGTRVTRNVLYDNTTDDFFTEVNHGPNLVDNNIFLSRTSIREWSEGSAFVHNLVSGRITYGDEPNRYTPYHFAHQTAVAGLGNIAGGDNRYYNNIFVAQDYDNDDVDMDRIDSIFYGLGAYSITKFDNFVDGNVYYNGAPPYKNETSYTEFAKVKPTFTIEDKEDGLYLTVKVKKVANVAKSQVVTTELLGSTIITESVFENADGTPISVDVDFFGNARDAMHPMAGPFENLVKGEQTFLIKKK